jgi:hypothetical protein
MTLQTPSRKKTTAKKRSTSEKAAAIPTKHSNTQESSPDDRHHMIAEAAYFVSEQRGFQGDQALDDWLQAEAELNALLVEKH